MDVKEFWNWFVANQLDYEQLHQLENESRNDCPPLPQASSLVVNYSFYRETLHGLATSEDACGSDSQ